MRGNQSTRHEIQKLLNELLHRSVGQSYLKIYVPMPACTVTPMIHVAEPSLISQCKQPFSKVAYGPLRAALLRGELGLSE